MQDPKETQVTATILAALALRGYWAWRCNSGGVKTAHGNWFQGAPNGTPDILMVLPGGYLAGIEAKTRVGKQRQAQKEWEARAMSSGVRYALARSGKDAVQIVRGWYRELNVPLPAEDVQSVA